MADIFQTTFSNAFSWMKMYKFGLRFQWNFLPRVQLTIFRHWFRWWIGAGQAPSHYLNQWMLVYWHIYASLGLNELTSIWRHCYVRRNNNFHYESRLFSKCLLPYQSLHVAGMGITDCKEKQFKFITVKHIRCLDGNNRKTILFAHRGQVIFCCLTIKPSPSNHQY